MKNIWLKSGSVTVIAVTATHFISFSVRAVFNDPADFITLTLATILPITIAMPISMFVFRQTEKLNRAHAALVSANEALARKASHDNMTGLLNRESFLSRAEVSRLSLGGVLLIVDVDHFKNINDRHGHATGDGALIQIAQALTLSLRRGDYAGRIGGEEFGAFLPGADLQEGLRVAQRVRGMIEMIRFTTKDGQSLPLTVSVGGALADDFASMPELMGRADACLYAAKKAGRNRVVIETELTVAA